MRLEPVSFAGRGRVGDFAWMAEQPDYAAALFIFNDNAEQFLAYAAGRRDAGACGAGGGNAVVRPLRCQDPPRAAGIPTGANGQGFAALEPKAKAVIDRALSVVRALLDTGRYDRVVYACADGDPSVLGTGIFHVGEDVVRYVPTQLERIVAESIR